MFDHIDDRQGQRITLERFNDLHADLGCKIVAHEELENGWFLSTVWLGIARGYRIAEVPLIFETMLFDDLCARLAELDHSVN